MNLILATSSNVATSLPTLDLSWTITAVIAIAAFLSPIFVSIINNRHARIMRKMDITHEEVLKKMETNLALAEKQFDIYYSDKKKSFSDFLQTAGQFSVHKQASNVYGELHSCLNRALLFCGPEAQNALLNFLNYINKESFGGTYSPQERESYSQHLMSIALVLNKELSSTQPTIDSKQTEQY